MINISDIYNQEIKIPSVYMLKCAAIWITKPVLTSKGITCRIATGDCVNVKDGFLCSAGVYFSHTVVCVRTSESNAVTELTLQSLTGIVTTICLYN